LTAFPPELQPRAAELGFQRPHKYAHVERERRWLLDGPPPGLADADGWAILDLYIEGTRLRLREMRSLVGGGVERKLTKKADLSQDRRVVTTIYLTEDEYALLASLPGHAIQKVRRSLHLDGVTVSVDVFDGPLRGLVLAEAEFPSDAEMAAFPSPTFALREVTAELSYSGGVLVRGGRPEEARALASTDSHDPLRSARKA
jgi:CYTH domain-containing protein